MIAIRLVRTEVIDVHVILVHREYHMTETVSDDGVSVSGSKAPRVRFRSLLFR